MTNGKKFSLIGTPQGHEHKDPSQLDLPDVLNDLDVDFSADPNSEAVRRFKNDARNKRKIREAVAALNVNLMNPLREGKGLLVLDLDYSEYSFSFPVSSLIYVVSHLGYKAADDRCSPTK